MGDWEVLGFMGVQVPGGVGFGLLGAMIEKSGLAASRGINNYN